MQLWISVGFQLEGKRTVASSRSLMRGIQVEASLQVRL